MKFLTTTLAGLVLPLSLGVVVAGCSGGSSGGGGGTTTTTTPAPTPTPSATATPPANTGSNFWYVNDTFGNALKTHNGNEAGYANEVLNLVNQERATAGLPALQLDNDAVRAAKAHAEDMIGRSYFSHSTPEGWSPSDRVTMTGGTGFSGVGENIAFGQQTPAAVMTAWMNSSGHRANILNTSYTHIGIGVADSQGPYWVQVFLRR